jgi:hypothetical protein
MLWHVAGGLREKRCARSHPTHRLAVRSAVLSQSGALSRRVA